MKDLFEKIQDFISDLEDEIIEAEDELEDLNDDDLKEEIENYKNYIDHLYDDWNENCTTFE